MGNNKENRIVLLDFIRGLLILWVIFDHFCYPMSYLFYGQASTGFGVALSEFCYNYEYGLYRKIAHEIVLFLFFFISGAVFNFSRNKTKRTVKLFVYALILFLVTFAFSLITKVNATITNGVIFVFAVGSLLLTILDRLKIKLVPIIIFAVILSVIGELYNLKVLTLNNGGFTVFVFGASGFSKSADYFPLLPYLGYLLIGYCFSLVFYKEKKPLVKINEKIEKVMSPITFIGRTSIWWYFVASAIFIVVFYVLIYYNLI